MPTCAAGAQLRLRDKAAAPGLVPSLNGLRALSIAIVVLSHTVSDKVFPGGFGVRVFFVVSGFLITRLLFLESRRRGSVSIPRFYLRRFLRLYPVILTYTGLTVLLCALVAPENVNAVEPLSALFYFANYHYAHLSTVGETDGTMPFAIFWSLSVEEHFYLVFPFAFLPLRSRPARLALLAGAVVAACFALRTVVALAHPELLRSYVFYYETQYQLDSISCGVLVAALCEFGRGREFLSRLDAPPILAAALLLILAGFLVRDAFFRETLRYSVMNAGIAALVAAVVFSDRLGPAQRLLNAPAMDFLGRISYSVYVWHVGAIYFFGFTEGVPAWARLIVVLAVTAAASCASYFLIERPLTSLRRRTGSVAAAGP